MLARCPKIHRCGDLAPSASWGWWRREKWLLLEAGLCSQAWPPVGRGTSARTHPGRPGASRAPTPPHGVDSPLHGRPARLRQWWGLAVAPADAADPSPVPGRSESCPRQTPLLSASSRRGRGTTTPCARYVSGAAGCSQKARRCTCKVRRGACRLGPGAPDGRSGIHALFPVCWRVSELPGVRAGRPSPQGP